jgi:hypothetical protein
VLICVLRDWSFQLLAARFLQFRYLQTAFVRFLNRHEFCVEFCVDCCRCLSWYCFLVTGSKESMIRGLNCSPALVFRTRPPGVRLNDCEGMNCFSSRFLSSILHVILLAPFRVFAVVSSPVLKADSLCIARRS